MNLLGASNLFIKTMNMYNKLKYIKLNAPIDRTVIRNKYNMQTQYDELLENLEDLYGFSNTPDNVEKLQLFLLRYEGKIKKEYIRVRNIVETRPEEVGVKVKALKFEVDNYVEKENKEIMDRDV